LRKPNPLLLASLSRAFAETGNDYPAILGTIARLVAEAAGDACVIRLAGGEGGALLPAASHHVNPLATAAFHQVEQDYRLSLAEGVYQEGSPVMVEDYMARPDLLSRLPAHLRVLLDQFPIHAAMVLPLRTPRHLLGTLTIWRSVSTRPYTGDDLIFWQDVADLAALAIENARLYADEVQRNRQLNALHDATTALLSTLDLEVLLGRILDAAQRAIPDAERGILYLVAPRTGRLEVRAISGFGDPRIRRAALLQNTQANRSMRERRPLLIRDSLGEDPAAVEERPPGAEEHPPVEARAPGTEGEELENLRSEIIAPLILGEEVLGALSLSSSRPFTFDQSDLQLLVSFAATTTAAIHNAMLHTELQKIAITDPLTGLYNRRGLLELGRHEVERFQRFNQPLSAIMLDIDHFKNVNDTYGHPVGDQVLCGLAERCRILIRQVDIIGRYGGEEFSILLPETDLFQASAIAERLRRSVEESPFFTEAGPISITVSLGVSRAGRSLDSLVTLIEQADAALYQAKQNGRNRVEIG
jgi:diguanylate cyclase (GGDEF)-like protein